LVTFIDYFFHFAVILKQDCVFKNLEKFQGKKDFDVYLKNIVTTLEKYSSWWEDDRVYEVGLCQK